MSTKPGQLHAVVKPVGSVAFVERKGKPLVALKPSQCRYPLNDPERGGEFLFYGEPIAKSGANYCSRHTEIAVRAIGSASAFSPSPARHLRLDKLTGLVRDAAVIRLRFRLELGEELRAHDPERV